MADRHHSQKHPQEGQKSSVTSGTCDAGAAGGINSGHNGRPLSSGFPVKIPRAESVGPSPSAQVTKDEVVRKIKYDYAFAHKDQSNRILDSFTKLIVEGLRPGKDIVQLLGEVAAMIDRHLQIRATTIGIRDPKDGRFRYVAQSGLPDDQWQAHKALSYSLQEFFDPSKYRSSSISGLTRLFMVEDSPYNPDEISTYNERLSSAMVRKSAEDCNEGDYFDIHIFGPGDKLLGWIEISGTKYGKMPDSKTLRWVEMIATVLGLVLTVRGYGGGNGKG